MKNKNVLILTPFFSPNLGGAETHLDDLCDYLTEKKYIVTVLTYQPLTTPIKAKGREKKDRLLIYRFNWPGYGLFTYFEKLPPIFNFLYLTPYLFLRTLLYLLKHPETEIIHAFGLSSAFIARWMNIFFGKKIIMSTEALYDYQQNSIFTKISFWVLNGFNKVLAQSEQSKTEMVKIGIEPERISVFAHWVNQNKFKPKDKLIAKKELGWDAKFTALYVGRLIPQKGIKLFLKLAEKSKGESITFKIIGDDGIELGRVKMAERTLNNVEYIGKVPYPELPLYYQAADVFIYPALYKEDMSRAILEALSCGTPVINTNSGSGVYALNSSVACIVKPTIEDLYPSLIGLVKNKVKREEMSKSAAQFSKKFGPKLGSIITDSY